VEVYVDTNLIPSNTDAGGRIQSAAVVKPPVTSLIVKQPLPEPITLTRRELIRRRRDVGDATKHVCIALCAGTGMMTATIGATRRWRRIAG